MALPSVGSTLPRRVVGASPAPRPVTLAWIPGGDAGTYATLMAMRRVVRQSVGHPLVIQAVHDVTGGSRDPRVVVRGLDNWLRAHTRFRPDGPVETVYTPVEQFRALARNGYASGDCDDVAVLAATLALAAGLRARFVVVGFGAPGAGASYRHVFTEARTPSGWHPFDITRNARSAVATRRATMEV